MKKAGIHAVRIVLRRKFRGINVLELIRTTDEKSLNNCDPNIIENDDLVADIDKEDVVATTTICGYGCTICRFGLKTSKTAKLLFLR